MPQQPSPTMRDGKAGEYGFEPNLPSISAICAPSCLLAMVPASAPAPMIHSPCENLSPPDGPFRMLYFALGSSS
jgi:hypothetical protein